MMSIWMVMLLIAASCSAQTGDQLNTTLNTNAVTSTSTTPLQTVTPSTSTSRGFSPNLTNSTVPFTTLSTEQAETTTSTVTTVSDRITISQTTARTEFTTATMPTSTSEPTQASSTTSVPSTTTSAAYQNFTSTVNGTNSSSVATAPTSTLSTPVTVTSVVNPDRSTISSNTSETGTTVDKHLKEPSSGLTPALAAVVGVCCFLVLMMCLFLGKRVIVKSKTFRFSRLHEVPMDDFDDFSGVYAQHTVPNRNNL